MGTPGQLPTVATYPSAIQPGTVTYSNNQQPAFYGNTQTAPLSKPAFGYTGTPSTQQFAPPVYSNMNNTYRNPGGYY